MEALKVHGTAADLLNRRQPSERPVGIRQEALGSSLKIAYVNPERLAYEGIQSFPARLHISAIPLRTFYRIRELALRAPRGGWAIPAPP